MKWLRMYFFFLTVSLMADCSFKSSTLIPQESEVIDKKTGLIWSRCSLGQAWKKGQGCTGEVRLMRLKEAEEFASSSSHGWRIPTIDELISLVDERCKAPVINNAFFGKLHNNGEGAHYLSSSVYLEGDEILPTLFYTIDFMNGEVDAHTKSYVGAIRLVRQKSLHVKP